MPPPDTLNPQDQTGFRERLTTALAFIALAAIYLGTAQLIDPDIWHQMALIREALAIGHLPTADPFAYTPTVEPMVHHEWGMGVVLYFVYTTLGGSGLVVLSYVLAVGIAVGCLLCARRRGATHPVLWALLPVAVFLAWIGLTLVRAQMFTLLFLSWLLWFLELDRAGQRWWIAPWLVIYVLWVNLHAGFVVGAIAFGLYTAEQIIHRRPVGRLIMIGLLMAALVAVNPYGLDYYAYLWHALRMERPLITEWQPLVAAWPLIIVMYSFSVLLIAYGLYRRGWRQALRMMFVFAAAYAAFRHQRHLSIYAVAWACFVPALLQGTALGTILTNALDPQRRVMTTCAATAAVFLAAVFFYHQPWRPVVPVNPGDHPKIIYPVGAVEYLRENKFRGKLLTPFNSGAFVSWNLYPDVLVSMDGRYEVAYPPDLLDKHQAFFSAEDGWKEFLEQHSTDAVLTRSHTPVAAEMAILPEWNLVYRDDAYEIHMRSKFNLPIVDRRGEQFIGKLQ